MTKTELVNLRLKRRIIYASINSAFNSGVGIQHSSKKGMYDYKAIEQRP